MARRTITLALRTPCRERPDLVTHLDASAVYTVGVSEGRLYVEAAGCAWEAVATGREAGRFLVGWRAALRPKDKG
jgi:hypothetical protein